MSDRYPSRNVLGGALQVCSAQPCTGFYRNGRCDTGDDDHGQHTVCVETTAEFLAFSRQVGNDLSTPAPQFGFSGLRPGDRWCLCAQRFRQAQAAGMAPRVLLAATHERALEVISLEDLLEVAIDLA
jgi:hypothetical protein